MTEQFDVVVIGGGPGGYASVIIYKSKKMRGEVYYALMGCRPSTTNNRMEMRAAILGLRTFKSPKRLKVVTDSKVLQKGITKWIHKWKRNGWKAADGKPVKNKDLWKKLRKLDKKHTIEWVHVRGHRKGDDDSPIDQYWNERADGFATLAKTHQLKGRTLPRRVDEDLRV